ncbi:MAG TPA: hypothetical protein VJR47_20260 [Stellaceae bacterium]|nr:hypothetical protein [Stellaceae bacterium]
METQIVRPQSKDIEDFLNDLTEISRKHGIVIGGRPILCFMERIEYQTIYRIDDDNLLSLG